MKLQVGVKIALVNSKGKILLLKRSGEKYKDTGEQWDIVGGRIEPGETLYKNLVREIKEETGITWKEKVKLIAAQDIIVEEEKHVVRLTYFGKVKRNPKIRIDKEEHVKYRWFSLTELKKLSSKSLDKYFKEVLNKSLIF